MQQAAMRDGAAVVAAAQQAGQAAKLARNSRYEAATNPAGPGNAVDEILLPPVPDMAVPASSSALYPYAGDEPIG